MLSRKKGVTKTGCGRHRPSRVGEVRELVETCFGTRRLGLIVCWILSVALQSQPRVKRIALWVRRGPWITDNGREGDQCKWAVDDESLVE